VVFKTFNTNSMEYNSILRSVIAEAALLKQHATAEELARIDLESFDGCGTHTCVYGQMTGFCWSKRALELHEKCGFMEGFYTPIETFVMDAPREACAALLAYLKGERDILFIEELEPSKALTT
jgi:hypothetical protein